MSALDILLGIGGLVLLYIVAQLFGRVVELLPGLIQKKDASFKIVIPAFLGMLLAGMLVANLPGGLTSKISSDWSKYIRKAVLGIILARAGLSMDIETLRKKSITTLCLATMPCRVEATVASCLLRLFRPETSWAFCFCLGFVLSSVSPAVVVPSLVALQDEGYGVVKGIPTMILAAASLDDIISICGFGVSLNLAFSQIDDSRGNSVALLALNAPISIVGGFLIGFCSAYCQFAVTKYTVTSIPSHSQCRKAVLSAYFRGGLLLVVSIAVVFAMDFAGYSAGGYLAVMVQACALATLWNELNVRHSQESSAFIAVAGLDMENQASESNAAIDVGASSVSKHYKTLWSYAQPALFMLIGAEVLFRNIAIASLQTAITILLIATPIRILITFLSVSTNSAFKATERAFVCLAWLPKATVQAALGSVVLDTARDMSVDDDSVTDDAIELGEIVLTLAVLSILITAPIGAVSIFITGPRWLDRYEEQTSKPEKTTKESDGCDADQEQHVELQIECHDE